MLKWKGVSGRKLVETLGVFKIGSFLSAPDFWGRGPGKEYEHLERKRGGG